MKYENKNICKKCGGACCKNGGCDFSVDDFEEITFDSLQRLIDEGLISIAADLIPSPQAGIFVHLFVRMRSLNSPAIDFIRIKPSPCVALTNYGCRYTFKDRPSGGKNLIPMKYNQCYYEKDVSPTWIKYQNVLRELVIRNTGLTPEEKMKERIEEVFYEFFQLPNCDEDYKLYIEYFEFLGIYKLACFRNEIAKAKTRCLKDKKLNRSNPFIGVF